MEKHKDLLKVFARIIQDHRISKSHMALYMALYYLWSKQQFDGDISVYSWQIMPIAKISTCATYYTVVKELAEYGYINYQPSFYRKRASLINLNIS